MTQNVYFSDDTIRKQVQQLARQESRSFSAMVQILLREALDTRDEEEAMKSGEGKPRPAA